MVPRMHDELTIVRAHTREKEIQRILMRLMFPSAHKTTLSKFLRYRLTEVYWVVISHHNYSLLDTNDPENWF